MATLAERILETIRFAPLDDDVLAKRLGVASRQSINQTARQLQAEGRLDRRPGPDGELVNAPILRDASVLPPASSSRTPPAAGDGQPGQVVPEDTVKQAVQTHLEAKGGVTLKPQQVTYFLGALGELVQRMSDPSATYALALPENRQYRGLVERPPRLARARLGLVVFWVDHEGHVTLDELR